MPAPHFAVLPFYIAAESSVCADFFPDKPHGLPHLISVHPTCIELSAPGTYLIYYYAASKNEAACTALFLSNREIKATRDRGCDTCGGAIAFLTDTVKSASLSLRLCEKIPESVKGFIVIAPI